MIVFYCILGIIWLVGFSYSLRDWMKLDVIGSGSIMSKNLKDWFSREPQTNIKITDGITVGDKIAGLVVIMVFVTLLIIIGIYL